MKKFWIILLITGCSSAYVPDSKMYKEQYKKVGKVRAKIIQNRLERKGVGKPDYIDGWLHLSEQQVESTRLRNLKNEIK